MAIKIVRGLVFALIAITPLMSGCGRLVLPDLSGLSVPENTQEINESVPTSNGNININLEQTVIIDNSVYVEQGAWLPVSNLKVRQIDEDVLLQWDGDADMFRIYRAWAYPNNSKSWKLVGVTTEKNYLVEGAYWSGLHYYAVEPVGGSLSNYVMYLPRSK